jgi:hypothetical protein
MNILHFNKKGAHTDTIKNFYIYKKTKNDNQINDKHTVSENKILKTMLKREGL